MQRCDVKKKHTQDWWLCEPWRYKSKWKIKIKIKDNREMLFLCYPPSQYQSLSLQMWRSRHRHRRCWRITLAGCESKRREWKQTSVQSCQCVLWVKTHKTLCCNAGGKQTVAQKVCWLQWWEWTLQSWFITDQIICYNVEAGVLFSSYPS